MWAVASFDMIVSYKWTGKYCARSCSWTRCRYRPEI